MEFLVTRMPELYQGFELALNNESKTTLAVINGNNVNFHGPIIVTEINQHVVYGLSHPGIVSRILNKGPQPMLTTKEISHNIFEHGMKASVGRVKIRKNEFTTSMDSFYTTKQQAEHIEVLPAGRCKAVCRISWVGCEPITFLTRGVEHQITKYEQTCMLDDIRSCKVVRLERI